MSELLNYVTSHTERGECKCGKCFDVGSRPDPTGAHTADLIFFKVSTKDNPDPDKLRELVNQHKGEFNNVNLFDGEEHSFMELGGWIGDQGVAMQLMGLGYILGLWQLLTPVTMLGNDLPDDIKTQMAGMGYITIKAKPS